MPLNSLRLVNMIDKDAELPGVMIRGEGADEIAKSGVEGLTTSILREAVVVWNVELVAST